MKRIAISLLLLAVMLAGMMNVQAAEAEVTVQTVASKTDIQVGDTVEFTVLATGSGVVAMQFELRLPEGLRYVPNSGATPENLAQKLGVPAADWTEQSMMFTFYNDVGITFAKGTEILRFSCVAEKEGEWTPYLYELLPFDGDYLEFTPQLRLQEVRVTTAEANVTPSVPIQTVPPTVSVTEPPASVPAETVTTTAPVVEATQPVSVPEPTEQPQSDDQPDTEETSQPEETTDPVQNQHTPPDVAENNRLWILFAAGAAILVSGVAVFFILKKKHAQNF